MERAEAGQGNKIKKMNEMNASLKAQLEFKRPLKVKQTLSEANAIISALKL